MRKPNITIGKNRKTHQSIEAGSRDVKNLIDDSSINYENTNLVNHIPFMEKNQPPNLSMNRFETQYENFHKKDINKRLL